MRVPTSERRARRPFRLRGWIIAVAVLLVVLVLSARGLAGFYTDYLWFDSVGFGNTWRSLLLAKIAPAAVFAAVFFVLMLVSLTIADRLAPGMRGLGPEDEMIARYQNAVGSYSGRIRIAVCAFFALIIGGSVSGQWRSWILFTHRVDFGIKDPQFHKDVGFYVFQLPFVTFIFNWLFAALVVILIVTAIAHYLNGGIRLQTPYQRVTPQVKAHLSVILALMALVKTAQYWYARYELNFSGRGVVQGASKTEIAAHLPALQLLMVISVVAAGLFVWNIRRRGWVLPIIAVGLWGFVSLAIGTIYPAIYQQVRVNPNELSKERPYIQRNITATREAFGLDKVKVQRFDYANDLDNAALQENQQTIDNARLWDPEQALRNFQSFQGLQTFYRFGEADVDRYLIGGKLVQVLIAARELNRGDLPSQTWVNRHIVYTHGYGTVVSPSNQSIEGRPDYLASDIPQRGDLRLTRPELYFGENLEGYALTGAEQAELNYKSQGGTDAFTRYTGRGGVELSSWLRRSAFALRFADWNLFVSGQVKSSTRILYLRDVRQRVEKAAPFLQFDSDPYPAVVDGRVLWVLDGYTTSNAYPYSQSFTGSGGLDREFNYVRNSVKATVDSYDGTIHFYVIDAKDPLVRAYRKAFPELFSDVSRMPEGLKAHLRYPQDLFAAQTDVYRAYHMTNPTTFYNKTDLWEVSRDPGTGRVTIGDQAGGAGETTSTTNRPEAATSGNLERVAPLYVLIRLPGQTQEQFILLRPFVPVSRGNALENLVSFMTATSDVADPGRSDLKGYGQLSAFVMPSGQTVDGPVQVDSQIKNSPLISQQFTLLGTQGSAVVQGSLQIIPIRNSLVYVRPVYVQATTGQQLPAFRFVIVYYGGQATFADSVEAALAKIPDFQGLVPTQPTQPTQPVEPPVNETVQSLLDQASKAYNDAQSALRAGDFAKYGDLMKQLGDLLDRAAKAAASGGSTSTPSTTTTTSATSTGQQASARR